MKLFCIIFPESRALCKIKLIYYYTDKVCMVFTVTFNPAVDRTVYAEELKTGELNRVK